MYNSLLIGSKSPEIVNAFIEIPKGTYNKYEFDKSMEVIKLDRVLHSPFFYPVDYGFIPQTKAEDGDDLDIMVLTDSPTFPGCLLEVVPVGILNMTDDKGPDSKILAVPLKNPHYQNIKDLKDIEPSILNEIQHFFEQYKKLENKTVTVHGWESKSKALELITKTTINQ